MDVFEHLQQSGQEIDFTLERCTVLPDLAQEEGEGYTSGWKGSDNYSKVGRQNSFSGVPSGYNNNAKLQGGKSGFGR